MIIEKPYRANFGTIGSIPLHTKFIFLLHKLWLKFIDILNSNSIFLGALLRWGSMINSLYSQHQKSLSFVIEVIAYRCNPASPIINFEVIFSIASNNRICNLNMVQSEIIIKYEKMIYCIQIIECNIEYRF